MLYLFPPPAATTTNCFFDLLPMNVIGVACALAGSFVVQISFPVSLSNARKRLSLVAPINNRPPAVTSEPPKLDVPVGGMPLARSSSTTPRTERQRKSPVSRLIVCLRNPLYSKKRRLLSLIEWPDGITAARRHSLYVAALQLGAWRPYNLSRMQCQVGPSHSHERLMGRQGSPPRILR